MLHCYIISETLTMNYVTEGGHIPDVSVVKLMQSNKCLETRRMC